MSTDLGHLFATLDIKDEQFKSKIAAAKTDLLDLKKAADDASKVSLDIKPKGAAEVDKAADSTDKLNESQKQADKTTVNVAPTGKSDVDAAAKATKDLEAAEKGADKAKVDVKPTGTADLDKAATSADGLGKKLDDAGAKSPDVAPTGADQLDSAAASATDLGDNLDHVSGPDVSPTGASELDSASSAGKDLDTTLDNVDGPDVTPTGTGDVTTAAAEAGVLDSNLQKAGQSGKNLSVSTQPAQELDNASNAAGGLVDKLGEVAAKTAGKAMKWGAVTAGTAAVGGLGVALTKGFSRLDSIDQANAKLQGLGHSAEAIDEIMDSAMDSVTGTAYGFGDAASLAAQMVASGIEPGEELTGVLTTVADTAAIAGRDIGDMGLIFGSVAAKGKLQGDDLMQLMAGGIPVLQMLAEETGKTTEEVSKMVSEGEVDFATFESAMKNSVGGAAQDAGNTVKGAMDNVGAAAGRLGAELLKPAFEAAPGVIAGITDKINDLTESAGPFAEKLTAGLSDFAQGAIPQVQGAMSTLKSTAETVWPVIEKIGSVMTSIPMGAYVALIGAAVAKHKGLTGALSNGTGVVRGWGTAVKGTQSSLQAQGREIGVVSSAMLTMQQRMPVVGRMGEAYRKAGDGMRVAGMMSRDAGREMGGIVGVGRRVQGSMQTLGGTLSGTVASGFSLAKSGASGLLTALGGPWGLAIGAASMAIMGLVKQHQDAAAEAAAHEQAQRALKDSLDETTGSITAQTRELQVKALEEAGVRKTGTQLGMSEDLMGRASTGDSQAEAEFDARVGGAITRSGAGAIEDSKFWQNYGDAYMNQGFSAEDYAAAIDEYERTGSYGSDFHDARNAAQAAGDLERGGGISGGERDMRNEALSATEAYRDLRTEVRGLGEDFSQVEADAAAERINKFAEEAEKASDAAKLLSDHTMTLGEDATEISVEMSEADYDKVRSQLDEIDDAHTFEDGVLTLSMPSGAGILELLQQIDGEIAYFDTGRIDIESTAPEVQDQLVELGMAVREFDDEGNEIGIHVEDDAQDTLERLKGINAFSIDPKTGELTINDNIEVVDAKMDEVDGRELSADLMVADNADAVVHNLGVVDIEARTLSDGRVEITDTSDENIERLGDL
ncbi:MAG: tape measure protein, partial [Corynebacterium sp.]|uniref:tape measure protein n=1 Tax=Corynebacterium sp. TaxID=1720 RepID=UPI003F8EA061